MDYDGEGVRGVFVMHLELLLSLRRRSCDDWSLCACVSVCLPSHDCICISLGGGNALYPVYVLLLARLT